MTTTKIPLPFVRGPYVIVSIAWEVDGEFPGSGSTECEAWRGQYEIDQLEQSGYRITGVTLA